MKTEKMKKNVSEGPDKWLIGSLVTLGIALVVLFSVLIYTTPDELYREPAGVNAANFDARLNSEDPEANYFGKYAPPEERVAPAPANADSVAAATGTSTETASETTPAETEKPKLESPSQATPAPAVPKAEQPRKTQQPSGESLFD